MVTYLKILLTFFIAKSYSVPHRPMLVSELPPIPLEPVDQWVWTSVGTSGYLYNYPLQFGGIANTIVTEASQKKPVVEDPNNLLSLDMWLEKQVVTGNITNDLKILVISITKAIKTITAITKFPVTRNIAVTKGIYETAAPTAFKDEILAVPGAAGLLFSSTDKTPLIIDDSKNIAVSIVPLLCSENIELGLPHGSTFLVSEMVWTGLEPMAAGYVLYGSATILILTLGTKVLEFTLDQDFTFRMTNSELKVPETGKYYSMEGFESTWLSPTIARIVEDKSSTPIVRHDCMIAEIHKVIKKGGLFMSPQSEILPNGKISIRYQLAPLAFVLSKSGGLASNGSMPILDLRPSNHNITSPVFMGSKEEVENLEKVLSAVQNEDLQQMSTYFPVKTNSP